VEQEASASSADAWAPHPSGPERGAWGLGGLPAAFLAALVLVAGCLPYSCRREPPEALLPADSLSRQVAQAVGADSLALQWSATGPDSVRLQFPRTVRFGPEGDRLYVSDAQRGAVYVFGADGTFERRVADERLDTPYLAGWMRDTLVAFSAGTDRFHFLPEGERMSGRTASFQRPTKQALVYTLATDDGLYAKAVGEETDGFVARLGPDGAPRTRIALDGPYWRHAGFLRIWGDSLLSLSGFRPVVDVLPRDLRGSQGGPAASPVDTMALVGFDSPMLPRSRLFVRGENTRAPLLSASAAPADSLLFVLNLRPAQLQVDIFGRTGRLQRQLIGRRRAEEEVYPRDIAVRAAGGGYDIALAMTNPRPQLLLMRWRPGASPPARRPDAARTPTPADR
jgi:hypothetical protein